jgi:hypothetical protein
MDEDKEEKISDNVYLKQIARDIREVRNLLTASGSAAKEAQSEIPENVWRFAMYMHDIRDFMQMYHETGLPVPDHIKAEVERCSDRFKHILEDLNKDGGAFEQVRRDMTQRGGNQYDHTRLLSKETPNETRNG